MSKQSYYTYGDVESVLTSENFKIIANDYIKNYIEKGEELYYKRCYETLQSYYDKYNNYIMSNINIDKLMRALISKLEKKSTNSNSGGGNVEDTSAEYSMVKSGDEKTSPIIVSNPDEFDSKIDKNPDDERGFVKLDDYIRNSVVLKSMMEDALTVICDAPMKEKIVEMFENKIIAEINNMTQEDIQSVINALTDRLSSESERQSSMSKRGGRRSRIRKTSKKRK